jgi:hypothetical protein
MIGPGTEPLAGSRLWVAVDENNMHATGVRVQSQLHGAHVENACQMHYTLAEWTHRDNGSVWHVGPALTLTDINGVHCTNAVAT